jgi:hypothetical protein
MHLGDGESTMNKKPAEVTELPHLNLAEHGRGFHGLMSAIESSRIAGRFGNLLVKSVAHCVLAETGRTVPPRRVALAPATELSSWANRSTDTDIDSEILVWIASHVHSKKRLKSTLMGISAFLTGIGATLSIAAPSLTSVVDLIA